MKRTVATPTLSARQRALLIELSDPLRTSAPIVDHIAESDADQLLTAAQAHGVLPAVYRKLAHAGGLLAPARLEAARAAVALMSGQSMLLMRASEIVTTAFASAGVRHAVCKGPVFARNLYAHQADRPFTDIDLLVHELDIADANRIMQGLGYESCGFADREGSVYGEYKWSRRDGGSILIELHTNLVHSPKLRAQASLSYVELLRLGAGDAESPVALMLVAGLHASFGHQFERLQLLVDVVQGARRVQATGTQRELAEASRDLGADLAIASALDLAAKAFSEPRARDLADRVSRNSLRRVARALVSPRVAAGALDASAHRRSWRRNAYRQMLVLAGSAR